MMGPTLFKLPKADINGHIQRVLRKHESDTKAYYSIQQIVESEIEEGCNKGRRSCTTSILWLKRTLEFIYHFMERILSGEEDTVKCAHIAYEKSLRPFHGWIIRGIFNLVMRAVPNKRDLIATIKIDPDFTEQQILDDMREVMTVAMTNIKEINRFYEERGQHTTEQINSIQFKP